MVFSLSLLYAFRFFLGITVNALIVFIQNGNLWGDGEGVVMNKGFSRHGGLLNLLEHALVCDDL